MLTCNSNERVPLNNSIALLNEEQILAVSPNFFDFNGTHHISSYSIKDLKRSFYDSICQSFSKAVQERIIFSSFYDIKCSYSRMKPL